MKRRGLGARLAIWTAATTVGALVLFGGTTAFVIFSEEEREQQAEEAAGETAIDDGESPADEALEQLAVPVAVTAPLVVLLAFLASRRLAQRVTNRIDGVVGAAQRMTSESLGDRLPVSPSGDELDDLATALNGLFARLDEGLAAQKQFVADASHELRTPLTVLRSELEIARRRPRAPAEWEAVADRAHAEVGRMTAMIEALLRLARTAASSPGNERVDGRALCDDVAARWRSAADTSEIQIAIDADDDAAVAGDADALSVALGNLVGNAIAHSPSGGVVGVTAHRLDGTVELVVVDQGPGVPLVDRERIFLPFARGATAADRGGHDGGVGLGLSVARRIVEAHRGELHVDDAPGGGARFIARLPAA